MIINYFSQNYEDSKTSKVWTAEDRIIHSEILFSLIHCEEIETKSLSNLSNVPQLKIVFTDNKLLCHNQLTLLIVHYFTSQICFWFCCLFFGYFYRSLGRSGVIFIQIWSLMWLKWIFYHLADAKVNLLINSPHWVL